MNLKVLKKNRNKRRPFLCLTFLYVSFMSREEAVFTNVSLASKEEAVFTNVYLVSREGAVFTNVS